ncbi:MAG: hypothetical protein RIR70_1003 [Pseudomonadota bacterium]|jgi:general secretion pathway protein E/type IV pilus assembly protein PilB
MSITDTPAAPSALKATALTPRLLGQTLIQMGFIDEDQLDIALREQRQHHRPLGRILVSLGFLSEPDLNEALSANLGLPSITLDAAVPDPDALALVPRDLASRHAILPINYDATERLMQVAVADTHDVVALDSLRQALPDYVALAPVIAGQSDILRAIDQHYGYELSIDGILNEIETGEIDTAALLQSGAQYRQPVVRLIDALLADATKRSASDIHFEPEQGFLRIRYRIDGILRQIRVLHQSFWPAMAVRLKVMAGMNIAESRAPQDGRISLTLAGRVVDFRVASQPTLHGENIVLRILDRHRGIVPLDRLGLTEAQLDTLEIMLERPEGMIVVTGPTGSGKTTTLYSILNHINEEGVNIMTLEDPVEYPMSMVRQTMVMESSKLDFANGVRSMLRQDPDMILVGEMRDVETAEMAFQAAMTGHQVFSTLHTNSAIGAIPRLLDMGVAADIMAGNIIGIIAQRLVRVLCPACRVPYSPSPREKRLLGVPLQTEPTLYRKAGCPACEHQGYRGRVTLMEILRMDLDLDDLVCSRASFRTIRDLAVKKGFRTLADDGVRRALDGTTSLEEVARVVDLTARMSSAPAFERTRSPELG